MMMKLVAIFALVASTCAMRLSRHDIANMPRLDEMTLNAAQPHRILAELNKLNAVVDAHIASGDAELMQLLPSQECLDATNAVTNATAALVVPCGSVVLTLAQSLLDFDTPDDILGDTCASFNDGCDDAVRNLLTASVNFLEICRADATIALVVPFYDVVRNIILAQLFAELLCLEADDELCLITLHSAFSEVDSDDIQACRPYYIQDPETEFAGVCDANCTDLANEFFDDAGCCFTGYLAVFQASAALAVPEVEQFTLPNTFCDNEMVFCQELQDLMVTTMGDTLNVPNPNGAVSRTSHVAAIIGVVATLLVSAL